MGCDIHGYVEVKNKNDLWWSGVINLNGLGLRNYHSFSLIFGVRLRAGDIPIAQDRGIPELSEQAVDQMTADLAEYTLHGESWIDYKEIPAVLWLDYGDGWRLLRRLIEPLADAFDHVRLVVWFDN